MRHPGKGGFFFGGAVPQVHTVLPHGSLHTSLGGQYSYRVLGPCCRLFDREDLPWPCCRLAWRSKEPSWRRVGRRFVPDLAARRCPSYAVELLQPGSRLTCTVITLFPQRLSPGLQEWWYSKLPPSLDPSNQNPPSDRETLPEGPVPDAAVVRGSP
ncbi:MAG: hypothetical protein ACK587_12885 [Cyanobacteriota bacterium]